MLFSLLASAPRRGATGSYVAGYLLLLLLAWSSGAVMAQTCNTVTVNQKTGGGQWQPLGTYTLQAGQGNSVTVSNTGTNGYVIVDAVRFVRAREPTIVVDNDNPNVSFTGSWTTSSATSGYIGNNYRHDGNNSQGSKSAVFTPIIPVSGDWTVEINYASGGNRASNVPVEICADAAPVDLSCVESIINQRSGGGQWQFLGTYQLAAGTDNTVTIANDGTAGFVIADAVRFTRSGSATVIVDNDDPGVTVTGSWTSSTSTSGYEGSNYLHDQNNGKGTKSVEYRPDVPVSGLWEVAIKYTSGSNRPSAVPVEVCPSQQGAANDPPVAAFTFTPTTANAPATISFDASASSDPDGTLTSFKWDFGDGSFGTGVTTDHVYANGGSYSVTLYVIDNGRATATATQTLVLNAGPTADLVATPQNGDAPLNVAFDATGSTDPDGSIVSYAWSFGDGTTATTGTASHVYTNTGTYRVDLTVTDDAGAVGTAFEYVTVTELLVDWGGDYVSASQRNLRNGNQVVTANLDVDGDGSFDDAMVAFPFSTTLPLTPTVDYNGVPFYGGIEGTELNKSNASFDDKGIRSGSQADYLNLRHQATGNLHGAIYFDKADFLNGGATADVQFDALSTLFLRTSRFEFLGDVRWLVREGTTFYVSEATIGNTTLEMPGITTDGNWAVYDPATDLNFDQAAATFVSQNFSDITGVGIVIDKDVISNVRSWLQLSDFEFRGYKGAGSPPNLAPEASFVATPPAGRRPLPVSFDAGASFDPDGQIVAYAWDFGDGTTATGVQADHTYASVGVYTVSLTVTDADGGTATTTGSVTVDVDNAPPVAAIFTPAASSDAPFDFAFDALDSEDPVGTIVAYNWDFGDGTTASGLVVNHTYAEAGQYTVTLTVTDSDGATDTDTQVIRATINGNLPPLAVLERDPGAGPPPLVTFFDARNSLAPEGSIVAYAWDLGDGTTSTADTLSHTYNTLGSYTVTLIVTSSNGLKDTATTNISVSLYPNTNPVADFYGPAAYPWTDDIDWSTVLSILDYGGVADGVTDNLAAFAAAQDAVVASGGGVVYFPAGTYYFSDDLYLKDGVMLRGDLPANTDAKQANYDPPTNFEFPAYNFVETGNGTDNSTAFKLIKLDPATANSASNVGLVYIDVNRAGIELVATDKPNATGENMLFFGVRSNNVGKPTPGVPKLSVGQKPYQRHCYRFSYNILGYNSRNILVANTRSNDNVTDNYAYNSYVVDNKGTPVDLTGGKALFNFTDHYVIEVGQGSGACSAATPTTCPENFREGIVVRDNWMFHTMRTALYARGMGLIVRDNVIRDQQGKQQWVHPTGTRQVDNGNTLENRGIDWAGWNVLVDGNDIEVYRHQMNNTQYLSIDGEGILLQECCGGTTVNGVDITNNTVNSYIGLYKVRDITDAYIADNDISTGTTDIDIIYVVANTNAAAYSINDVVVENNDLSGAKANIRFRGTASPGTGNFITGNTSSGGKIIVDCVSNPTIANNVGFTVDPCIAARGLPVPSGEFATSVREATLFPNPATDEVTVSLPATERGTLRLLNGQGQVVRSRSVVTQREVLQLHGLPAGLYLLELDLDGRRDTRKLTIR